MTSKSSTLSAPGPRTEQARPLRGGVAVALRRERDVAAVGVVHAVLLHRARDDARAFGRQRGDRIVRAQPEVDAVVRCAAPPVVDVPCVAGRDVAALATRSFGRMKRIA